tara:strand:- start:11617 stop:12627 length:1011 start_codon:yes stop_codon:yes gene_type:complete
MLVPGSIPNIIFSKSLKDFSVKSLLLFYKNSFFISLFFFLASILYLGFKFEEFQLQIVQIKSNFDLNFIILLVPVLFLQIVNWSLEALKLKFLLSKYNPISLTNSLKAVYIGNFTALITPERIGNFLGRVMVIKENKQLTTILTIYGNSFQLLVTIFMGMFGFLALLFSNFKLDILQNFENLVLALVYFVLTLLIFIALFNLKWLKIFNKISVFKNWIDRLKEIRGVSMSTKINVLAFSFLRYFTFTLQFYLLCVGFELPLTLFELIIYLGLLFGVITLLPSLLPGNIGTKEAFCIFLLGGGCLAIQFSVLCFIIWFVNVGLSALVGGIFLLAKRN